MLVIESFQSHFRGILESRLGREDDYITWDSFIPDLSNLAVPVKECKWQVGIAEQTPEGILVYSADRELGLKICLELL